MNKKILLFLIVSLTLLVFGTNAIASGFSDVPDSTWYAKDLNDAVNKGLIKGIADDIFSPDENITYAQFITILVREKYGEQPLTTDGYWADNYIKKAMQEGIVDPYKEVPGWDKEISRGMTAMFMCRSLGLAPDVKEEIIFADCSKPNGLNYYKYLTKAYKEYLLDGTGFGTDASFFKKNTDHWLPVTRAQLATMIIRVSKYRENPSTYKSERAKVRDTDFAARRAEYAKTISLKYQSSSEHFDFYMDDKDTQAIQDLAKRLEDNYARIASDLKASFSEKVRILIYPDIESFHKAAGQPQAQNWFVGTGGLNELKMVSPLNPGGVHTYDSLMQTVVHEFTHTAVWNISGKVGGLPKWLSEGFAAYEAKQISIKNIKSAKQIPTLNDLETKDYSLNNGYDFAYTVVEFMAKKYGIDKVVELIKNPTKYEEILGVSKSDFEKQWLQYLNTTYQQ